MKEKFNILETTAVPLPIENIDTDQIIPARFLKATTRDGFGENLFRDWRFQSDGSPISDFVLNNPTYTGKVLVAGKNFGCGSSREHAPIAMGAAGVEAVVADSFARIFFRNCVATGELYPYDASMPLSDIVKTGDIATLDFEADTLTVNGVTHKLKPLGEVRPVIDAGGIFNYARQTGMISSS
ncbi:MAG: 3-isopropylmalate dehydratase small subunit [Bacteroidota bacterium]